ncbi:hypothetical protein BDQ12DRAFT_584809, partial [Crucibulum laeve]
SQLVQLRTGHGPLAGYLHRIGKLTRIDHARIAVQESIQHFLFDCPTCARERAALDRVLGSDSCNLKYVITTEKGIEALLKFVHQT